MSGQMILVSTENKNSGNYTMCGGHEIQKNRSQIGDKTSVWEAVELFSGIFVRK